MSSYALLAGGFSALETLSRVSSDFNRSGFASAASVTLPQDIRRGDLIFVMGYSVKSSSYAFSIPSGFTLITQNIISSGSFFGAYLSYKVAVGNEQGQTLTNDAAIASGSFNEIMYIIFRGNRPITTASVNSVINPYSGGAIGATTITSSAADPTSIITMPVAYFRSNNTPVGISYSPSPTGTQNFWANYSSLYWNVYGRGATRSNTVVSMGDSSVQGILGCYLQLS
jgi:hypothetical protein